MEKNFEVKPNMPEQKVETFLNEWDRKIILEGSKNVVEKMLEEFKGKLPNGIIYPDTSARPLFYLFDPIFSKISKERKIKKPTSFFMKISHPDTLTTVFEDNEGHELFYDQVEKELLEKMEQGDVALANNKDYFLRKAEDTGIKRGVEVERASEIENYNEKLSGRGMIANLAVIDDFSMQGQTRKEIDYAFGYEIPYFSLFSNKGESKVDKEKTGISIDVDNFPNNPTNDYNTKLSYTIGDPKRAIGVTKKDNIENKYSEVNKNQTEEDREKVSRLRKEMQELGQIIADNME